MNILVVSQYFPPYNTPRSFRTYELAKEFARLGHDVTVYGLIGNHDNTDLKNRYNITVKDYGPSFFGNADSTGYWNKNIIFRVCAHLFSRFEFPSMELSLLIKRKLADKISDYDLIVSIAWPFWVHFGIGLLKIKSKDFPVWISDCGDPFFGNPFVKHPKFYKKIERWWGGLTDYITVPLVQAKDAYLPEIQDKIRVIPQGFNFSQTPIEEYKRNVKITFVYAGRFYEGIRDPRRFLDYLATLEYDFVFKVYTKDKNMLNAYKDKLGSKLEIHEYVNRDELLRIMSTADFLINIKNIGTVQAPSKLIDYTLANRPILSISSGFDEIDKTKFRQFCDYDYTNKDEKVDISAYDIKNVAEKFLELYNTNKKK